MVRMPRVNPFARDVPPGFVQCWTVQNPDVWPQVKKNGIHTADPARVEVECDSMPAAYAWITRQMNAQLGGEPAETPVWVFVEPSEQDLRKFFRAYDYLSKDKFLIELVVDAREMVVTDFLAWEGFIYCGYAFSKNKAHDELLDQYLASLSPQEARRELELNWELIFDNYVFEWADPDWRGLPDISQGCMKEIRHEQVIRVFDMTTRRKIFDVTEAQSLDPLSRDDIVK